MQWLLLVVSCSQVLSSEAQDYLPSPYHYQYGVNVDKEHLHFGHQETADGGGSVKGSYKVLLPDGRLQRVSYSVSGDSGYVVEVSYDGQAVHPPPSVYDHHHRIGKSQQDFPSQLKNQPLSARPERPIPNIVATQTKDTLDNVVGSVFDENLLQPEKASITFGKPTNSRLEFTPLFSGVPQQQPIFGSRGVFGSKNQQLQPQPVGQNFLFPGTGTFQNLPPNQFVTQKPRVKTTIISGKSGFLSISDLPEIQGAQEELLTLEE